MSRSKGNRRTSKATGRNCEYWSPRPVTNGKGHGGKLPGRDTKTLTHRLERRQADRDLRKEDA